MISAGKILNLIIPSVAILRESENTDKTSFYSLLCFLPKSLKTYFRNSRCNRSHEG